MKEPLPFNKPPRRGNSRAERREFERKMQVSRLWIHKEMISVDQFVFASALNIPLFRIVPIGIPVIPNSELTCLALNAYKGSRSTRNHAFDDSLTRSTLAAHSMAVTSAICSERAAKLYLQEDPPRCMLANETKLLLSRALANSVAVGDEITFPIPELDAIGPEILVSKNFMAGTDPPPIPSPRRTRQSSQTGQT